jgi:alpha-glucosidase
VAQTRVTAHAVHHLGVRTVSLIIANSARRQMHAVGRRGANRSVADPMSPGRLVRAEVWNPRPGTAQFLFERGQLEVAFLADDVVRTSWGPGTLPVPYALSGEPPWPAPDVQAHPIDALRADGPWVMRSDSLEVTVAPDGSVRMARPGGPPLWRESPPARRGAAWQQSFAVRPGERLSGLGEQAGGIDLRGTTVQLWNRDPGGSWGPGASPLYLGIPVMVSTHPDGDLLTFWENSTDATLRLAGASPGGVETRGSPDVPVRPDAPEADSTVVAAEAPGATAVPGTAAVAFAGGVLRRYVVAGPVPHLLDRYTELTGRPALPPRWALGYHQSRWGYRTEADVRGVVDGYRTLELPLSALHLDIDYMRGFRVFTVDTERFPDLGRLAASVGEQGVRLVTIVDPGVKVDPGYEVYRQGRDQHRFCTDERGHLVEGVVWPGRSVYPDFTDPAARSWWAEQYRTLTDAGVEGIWHDMNEPTSIALRGDPTLPTSTRHHFDGRGGDHGEGHNLYGLLMNRAGYNGLRAARPDSRPFIVSRSGWAGMQRYAWNWTGDAESTWASMRQQIATVVGLGLSGVPYSGSDIGGFSGVPDDELYLRWLQTSVCMPFCRTHSVLGVPPREPWCFEEPTRAVVTAWIRFRYRLLPYLYTLAHQAAESGVPLVRPLWWPAPDDDTGLDPAPTGTGGPDVDDAFFLGPSLLVAPVTSAGARQRTVALPAGRFVSLWGDEVVERRQAMLCAAPLERIPVLARVGSVVPLDDGWAEPGGPCRLDGDGPSTMSGGTAPSALALDHGPRRLAFHCWADDRGEAEGLCIDDAGDGHGPLRRDRVRVQGMAAGETARVAWERSGEFAPPTSLRVVMHGLVAERASADGVSVPVTGGIVECGPFSELLLHGLAPAPDPGP